MRHHDPVENKRIDDFHPGPEAFLEPRSSREAPRDRLARLESEYLERAIERGLASCETEERADAGRIVALRAEVGSWAA